MSPEIHFCTGSVFPLHLWQDRRTQRARTSRASCRLSRNPKLYGPAERQQEPTDPDDLKFPPQKASVIGCPNSRIPLDAITLVRLIQQNVRRQLFHSLRSCTCIHPGTNSERRCTRSSVTESDGRTLINAERHRPIVEFVLLPGNFEERDPGIRAPGVDVEKGQTRIVQPIDRIQNRFSDLDVGEHRPLHRSQIARTEQLQAYMSPKI